MITIITITVNNIFLQLKAMTEGRDIRIEVDGGVNAATAGTLAEAGADVLVAGSSVFKGGPEAYGPNIAALLASARGGSA